MFSTRSASAASSSSLISLRNQREMYAIAHQPVFASFQREFSIARSGFTAPFERSELAVFFMSVYDLRGSRRIGDILGAGLSAPLSLACRITSVIPATVGVSKKLRRDSSIRKASRTREMT